MESALNTLTKEITIQGRMCKSFNNCSKLCIPREYCTIRKYSITGWFFQYNLTNIRMARKIGIFGFHKEWSVGKFDPLSSMKKKNFGNVKTLKYFHFYKAIIHSRRVNLFLVFNTFCVYSLKLFSHCTKTHFRENGENLKKKWKM